MMFIIYLMLKTAAILSPSIKNKFRKLEDTGDTEDTGDMGDTGGTVETGETADTAEMGLT